MSDIGCKRLCCARDCNECGALLWAFRTERDRFAGWRDGQPLQGLTPEESMALKTLRSSLLFAELFARICRRHLMRTQIDPFHDAQCNVPGYQIHIRTDYIDVAMINVTSVTMPALYDLVWRMLVGRDAMGILSAYVKSA